MTNLTVSAWINMDALAVPCCDGDGQTIFHIACKRGRVKIVQILLDYLMESDENININNFDYNKNNKARRVSFNIALKT